MVWCLICFVAQYLLRRSPCLPLNPSILLAKVIGQLFSKRQHLIHGPCCHSQTRQAQSYLQSPGHPHCCIHQWFKNQRRIQSQLEQDFLPNSISHPPPMALKLFPRLPSSPHWFYLKKNHLQSSRLATKLELQSFRAPEILSMQLTSKLNSSYRHHNKTITQKTNYQWKQS